MNQEKVATIVRWNLEISCRLEFQMLINRHFKIQNSFKLAWKKTLSDWVRDENSEFQFQTLNFSISLASPRGASEMRGS